MQHPISIYVISILTGVVGCSISLQGDGQRLTLQGAPPVIPHAVRDEYNCQHCHQINNNPGSSHLLRRNCRQCHVSDAATEKHQMLEIDGEQFPGFWQAESVKVPKRDLDIIETYDGAPPAIPHSTVWAENCLSCHTSSLEDGLATSHPNRRNCTQCHVPVARIESRQFLEMDRSAFQVGWESPVTSRKQNRRNPARLPTVIPHEINGYEDCLMCHSPEDTTGLATTHPERKSCTQCHVTEATTEDRKFLNNFMMQLK